MIQRTNVFLLCYALIAFATHNAGAQEAPHTIPADTEKPQNDPCKQADELISKGQIAEAKTVLEKFITTMPANWKPLYEENGKNMVICWNKDEFIAYAHHQAHIGNKKEAVWPALPSYSQAFYLLGFIAVENKDFSSAIPYFDKALSLEPDHPTIWCEKAFTIRQLSRNEEAYQLYLKALEVRPWATDHQRAVALRGAGFALIELGKLDEAEKSYTKSLEFEPDNSITLDELTYIKHLKSGGAKGSSKMIPIATNVTPP